MLVLPKAPLCDLDHLGALRWRWWAESVRYAGPAYRGEGRGDRELNVVLNMCGRFWGEPVCITGISRWIFLPLLPLNDNNAGAAIGTLLISIQPGAERSSQERF